jgi:hypothetical protein
MSTSFEIGAGSAVFGTFALPPCDGLYGDRIESCCGSFSGPTTTLCEGTDGETLCRRRRNWRKLEEKVCELQALCVMQRRHGHDGTQTSIRRRRVVKDGRLNISVVCRVVVRGVVTCFLTGCSDAWHGRGERKIAKRE